jgi:hypothetical protein
MKSGMLDRIRAVGHWRVVFRPLTALPEKLSLQRGFDAVEKARVSIRGWDFPHISRRDDDQGGTERAGDFIENWCDWQTQVEFWRMYRSGQFLAYTALNDDMVAAARNDSARQLEIVDAIYTVTEFFEFGFRLAQAGLYRQGFHANVKLIGSANRPLVAGRGRMGFFSPHTTSADTVELERTVDAAKLDEGALETSLSALLELFDHFGWNPAGDQIRGDQEAFYRREFR